MSLVRVEVDDELVERAMHVFGLGTRQEAVHLALWRLLGGEPMSIEEQLDMGGTDWDGDLDAIRTNRFPGWNPGTRG